MIVYNVALNTGGVTNATFGVALHEMPIMVPVAFVDVYKRQGLYLSTV